MNIQTWAAAASIAAVVLTALNMIIKRIDKVDTKVDATRTGLQASINEVATGLGARIDQLKDELRGDIIQTRTELKSDLGKLDARLTTIEQRTYDLSTRLPPAPAAATGTSGS